MDRDRWRLINDVFHAVLELPVSDRREFVAAASHGDAEIQSEVHRMLDADAHADSYLESSYPHKGFLLEAQSFPPPFERGDLLKNRFRILAHIGEGGMGHVFEGHDTELNVRVALKAIRPEIAGDSKVLAFFRREVLTARTITHSNVCRTFDLDRGFLERDLIAHPDGSEREFFFLTMEFLDGETLAARLKRSGRLTPDEALAIARQVAFALEAAYAAGVVHRDIKPANVMLVPTHNHIRAVVMDFGLAHRNPLRVSTEASAISQAGPIGTLTYMAPEQMEPGSPVSPATDIYSFGLVLFEMLTGARAFPSVNLLSGIAQRISGPPPSPSSLVPNLPEAWESAIQRCLRLAPQQRFQSVSEVIAVLDGKLPLSSHANESERSKSSHPSEPAPRVKARWVARPSVLFWASISLAAVVALFLIGLRLYLAEADSKVAAGTLVYLTPVKNMTNEHSLDNMTELLHVGLTQSAHINLLDQSMVNDTLQLMTKPPDIPIDEPIAREIAMRTGAARVIFTSVTGGAGHYQLEVDIQRPDPSGVFRYYQHWPRTFTWQTTGSTNESPTIPAELLTQVREATNWIRDKAGESKNDIARVDAPPEDITTSSWEALRAYTNSERFASNHEPEKAVLQLKEATTSDPKFALAYARLGDLLFSVNRASQGYEAYDHALSADMQHRLSRKERDFIKGAYAVDTWDFQTGDVAFRDYAAYYENDYNGVFFRAYPLRMLGRISEAVDVLNRAREISGSNYGAYLGLGYDYLLLGDFTQVQHCIDDLKKRNRPDEAALLAGHLAFLMHRYPDAEAQFKSLASSKSETYRSLSYSLLARVDAERGRPQDALMILNAGIEHDRGFGKSQEEASKLIDKAYLECHSGSIQNCVEDSSNALMLDSRPEMILRVSSIFGTAIAKAKGLTLSILRSHLKQLHIYLDGRQYGPIYDLARLRVSGELKLAEGDVTYALKDFLNAANIDSAITDRDYLARGFEAAANVEPHEKQKRELQQEELAALARGVSNPATIWYYSPHYPPGFYVDQTENYLRVASQLKLDGILNQSKSELATLRNNTTVISRKSK